MSGARELARRAGATLHLSHAALVRGVRYAADVAGVGDGDALTLGREAVHVVALPGHTTDMVGVRIGDEALIGGDSLFLDSVARPDLEAGDEGSAMAARQLLPHAARARADAAPVDAPAAVPLRRRPSSGAAGRPLGDVRAAVPELDLDEDGFVHQVLGAMPPRPANYLEIIAVNLGEELEPETPCPPRGRREQLRRQARPGRLTRAVPRETVTLWPFWCQAPERPQRHTLARLRARHGTRERATGAGPSAGGVRLSAWQVIGHFLASFVTGIGAFRAEAARSARPRRPSAADCQALLAARAGAGAQRPADAGRHRHRVVVAPPLVDLEHVAAAVELGERGAGEGVLHRQMARRTRAGRRSRQDAP